MLYSLRKYIFLWVLRRKKLIVLALQILMWTLKISPWMLSQGTNAVCLLSGREGGGCPGYGQLSVLSQGSSSQMRWDPSILSKGICRQVTSAEWPQSRGEMWSLQGKRDQAPSTILWVLNIPISAWGSLQLHLTPHHEHSATGWKWAAEMKSLYWLDQQRDPTVPFLLQRDLKSGRAKERWNRHRFRLSMYFNFYKVPLSSFRNI